MNPRKPQTFHIAKRKGEKSLAQEIKAQRQFAATLPLMVQMLGLPHAGERSPSGIN
jgi:hypothetical protein